MELSELHREILRALIDRIIPKDDYPSASENGVVHFICQLLGSDLKHRADEVRLGLSSLNEEAVALDGQAFPQLSLDQQDQLLQLVEMGENTKAIWMTASPRFFELIVRLTNEGYYADSGNGANIDGASWRMIGYDPRLPAQPVAERWLEKNS